jgi:predicted RNase H-like nuclease (RuvC/YqgF family)
MGNQIKFSAESREKSSTDDDAALEMENIQLKNTNRKLISKLDQQKQLNKNLKEEIDSLKNKIESDDINNQKKDLQSLKNKNTDLEKLLLQSRKEIKNLKNEINKLKNEPIPDSKSRSPWDKIKKLRS